MMWDQVMARVMAELSQDAVIVEIYGTSIRMAGTGEQQVPGLEWTLIGDTENELWAPMIVQFDQWIADGVEPAAILLRRSELRLRTLYHRDQQVFIDHDLKIFSEYTEGSTLATPDRSGYVGRAIRFRFTPLRRQYAFRSGIAAT